MKPISLKQEIERRELANRMAPFPVYDTDIINDLKLREEMITKQDDYNNVPVTYCKVCLSIQIKVIEFEKKHPKDECRDVDFCPGCGNTDVDKVPIGEWEEMYEEKYGEKFLNMPVKE